MKDITEMEDVFTEFGYAAYHAQIMEYDIVSVWMLDSIKQGMSLKENDLLRFQESWGKKTFGQLLRPFRKNNLISKEIKEFLEQLRQARNRLVHSFFIGCSENLLSKSGRKHILNELKQICKTLEKGQIYFSDILKVYLNDYGIDTSSIPKIIFKKIKK